MEEKPLCGSPAGRPNDALGQQPVGVIVLNARDERAIAWLIDQVGFDAVQQACGKMAGNRRFYPTNLAKVLGLSIPQSVILTPSSEAREHIRGLLSFLSSRKNK